MSTDSFSDKSDVNKEPQSRQIGRYLLQDRLGSGGTATVYQAYDQVNGQSVALKVLPSTADDNTLERFRREAMTSGGLRHPHIVRTIQVGVASHGGDIAYIAMELIDGETLGQLLTRRGRLHPEESCSLLAPIASALAYAHSEGIVHRDVKPSNILLKPSRASDPHSVQLDSVDNPIVPMLSDFGIARALDAPDLTASGRTVGTPAYMAPEQCRGGYDIDGRADIYALAAVLFRCLVGRQPFLGNTPQILHAHVYEPLKIEDDIFRRLSPLVVEILQNGMAKKPGERYRDAKEMAAAMASAAGITLTQDAAVVRHETMNTVTLASLETIDEPPTISETVIIAASETVDSLAGDDDTPLVVRSISEPPIRRADGAAEDHLLAEAGLDKDRRRPTVSPPSQTTETSSTVHMMGRETVAEPVTWGQRLERIRWAWIAFISVGILFLAGISAMLFGGYLNLDSTGNLFRVLGNDGTATVIPASVGEPDVDSQNDGGAIVVTITTTAESSIIFSPNATEVAQFTEEAQAALTATAAISLTAVANTAPTATAAAQLTLEATTLPTRFLTAAPTLASTPTATFLPATALPLPPATPTARPATPIPPTQIPTLTLTTVPPTPTWTPLAPTVDATATVESTAAQTTPAENATELATLAPTDAPIKTPIPTDTPEPPDPVAAPTPTWTTAPEDSGNSGE